MSKPIIVIVEGAQGCGKSKVTTELREQIKCSTLISETGVHDKTYKGEHKAATYHNNIRNMITQCRNLDMNFILCRSFLSEKVYCNLKYKPYTFNDYYKFFIDDLNRLGEFYDIYFVVLTCTEQDFKVRLNRDKVEYNPFTVNNSLNQQKEYIKELHKISKKYTNIKCIEIENNTFKDTISNILNIIKEETN